MMYSKEKGFTNAPTGEILHRRPHRAPRVSVPPNYRGHAIVDGEERPLGNLGGDAFPTAPADPSVVDAPVPRFDDLPRVSRLGDSHRHRPPAYTAEPAVIAAPAAPADATPALPPSCHEEPRSSPADFSQPLPSAPLRSPGILSLGSEELLLLGLILLLLREGNDCSDRGDLDETVILLGLLLLLG